MRPNIKLKVKYLFLTMKSLSLLWLNKQPHYHPQAQETHMSIFGILFLLFFGYVIVDIIRSIKLDNPNNKENK